MPEALIPLLLTQIDAHDLQKLATVITIASQLIREGDGPVVIDVLYDALCGCVEDG